MVLLVWIIPGCSTRFIAQDNGTVNNSNYNEDNSQDNNTEYDEYNVDDLNQYGDWVNINEYGRVWQPSVIVNWQPFTNGHWTYDGNDWVWVSYEPFGWIVYHYGSWENTPEYGWFWIPGRDAWSPARVQWIDYGDNIGWAPMRANNKNWSEPWDNNRVHPWMVVKMEDFNRENIISYGVSNTSRSNNNQNQIQRGQPNLRIVQSHVKEPIKIVQINKEPIRNETPPVRTISSPVRNDNSPVRTTTPPVNNNVPLRSDPPIRVDNTPVRTNTPPVINRNTTNVKPPSNRNIIHMQVPQEEKQKVDRYQPKVVKDVLIKRNPRPVINNAPKSDGRNNNEKKAGDNGKN
jgi:hypothetical protein